MEKVYFTDFIEIKDNENAQECLSDLQKRYPASSFINLLYLKLQPNRVQSRNKSKLLLTLHDRSLFNEISIAAAPIIDIKKDKPVLAVVEKNTVDETDALQPIFVKHDVTHLDDKHEFINQLIDEFSNDAPKIIYSPEKHDGDANYGKDSLEEDPDVVSETLANIYAGQGYVDKAVQMFENLMLHFPEKSCYFAAQIDKIKKDSLNKKN